MSLKMPISTQDALCYCLQVPAQIWENHQRHQQLIKNSQPFGGFLQCFKVLFLLMSPVESFGYLTSFQAVNGTGLNSYESDVIL